MDNNNETTLFSLAYNLPHDLICKCSKPHSFNHLLNCNLCISNLSVLHDVVWDQIHVMAKSYKIESFVEPLLSILSFIDENESCGQRRADVIVPSSSVKPYVVDIVTVDVCKLIAVKKSLSEVSPLFDEKFSEYNVALSSLKCVSHVKGELCTYFFKRFFRWVCVIFPQHSEQV
ncbi:hypothetical protein RCL1_002893 [Eukaryota sp. TZLM3-RCL]